MTEIEVLSKRGLVKYEANPFLVAADNNTKQSVRKISNSSGDRHLLVNEGTGEVIAGAGFWHTQDVDTTQFVKLYVNGVKAFKELSGAGTKVFEVLYTRVQESIGRDFLYISYQEIDQEVSPMSKATFMKGMKELIVKSFLAESMVQNKYYLNPDYMWNGDRLAFVKEYRKIKIKNTKIIDDNNRNELRLLESQS